MQQVLVAYVINAAWQIPLVAACAFAAARFASLSPRARNRLWLAFLACAAILPAVSLKGVIPHPAPVVARIGAGDPLATALPADPAEPMLLKAALATAPAAEAAAEPELAPPLSLTPAIAWTLTALVAAFALALAVRLASAALAARRLVRGALPATLPDEATEALEALALAHGRRAPPVLASSAVRSPAVVGAIRPVILMPQDLAAAPQELAAALLHEMAHVVRRDYAVNLACELLTLPVAWHPALMGLKAGVRASRELACDAIAASAMASRKTYAQCLVSLARSLGDPDRHTNHRLGGSAQAALAVGLFGRSDLEDRLMHLMKPRETDAPFVGAARALGLAAVGASVLGSAALLHVTPVLAQVAPAPQPRPVASAALAEPAQPAVPATPTAPAVPAVPAVKPHHHLNMIYNRDGVTIERGQGGYRHSWTGSDGVEITVTNDNPSEPTAEQKQRWEADSRVAEAAAAKAEAMVNSPEFKARIAKAQDSARKAQEMVNSPEFKARIAKAQEEGRKAAAYVDSPEFKARIAKATEASVRAEAMVNSPEFKARMAAAKEAGERAQAMVNSPEFKARIEKAAEEGAKAQAMVNSPEFKARMQKMQADMNAMAERMAHDFDDPPSRATP